MVIIKDVNDKIIKEIKNVDDYLISIMKDTELSRKYNISFEGNIIQYLDKLLNKPHFKLIVTIYSTFNGNIPIFIDTVVKASDLLPSISWYNIIEKMYFKDGYLYISLFNQYTLYRIRIIF